MIRGVGVCGKSKSVRQAHRLQTQGRADITVLSLKSVEKARRLENQNYYVTVLRQFLLLQETSISALKAFNLTE